MPDDRVPNRAWIRAVKTTCMVGKIRAADLVGRVAHPARARVVAFNGEATTAYLSEAIEAARADGSDAKALGQATNTVAIQVTHALGTSATPGFEIALSSGARYRVELAIADPTSP